MVTYLEELRDLVMLHARAQNMDMAECRRVLGRIQAVDLQGEGGWGREWAREGDRHVAEGKADRAFQFYNLARFPYSSNEDMASAHAKCVSTFNTCALDKGIDFKRLTIGYQGFDIPCYFSSAGQDKPLLLVMGGIVSIKEQWQAFLWAGKKLGVSVLVAEMPGVGENPLRYDESSYAFVSKLIDAAQDLADVSHTHVVAMSFSGNLAIGQALKDQRVRAITTVGAPVHAFFTDHHWWGQVPQTTKRTLAHLCQVDEAHLFGFIARFAIDKEQLAALRIPLYYVRSMGDEIIPAAEKRLLTENVERLSLREYNDVHGSPGHMGDLQKYVPMTVLKETGGNKFTYFMLNLMLVVGGLKRKARGVPR